MPISRVAVAAACLVLAGCGGGFGLTGGGTAATEVAVTSDRIVVTGPAGFCVDPTATRDEGDTGFVLLGNCAAISNSRRDAQPVVPAVLTAAISGPSDGTRIADSLGELDSFFRSAEGLQLLSRSQDAGTVRVLDTHARSDIFYLHAIDTSDGPVDGVQQEYWRAYMDVGDRIATLSVIGLAEREIAEADSRATLNAFTRALRAANAPGDGRQAAVSPAPAPVPIAAPPLTEGPLWNVGLFRRIFQ